MGSGCRSQMSWNDICLFASPPKNAKREYGYIGCFYRKDDVPTLCGNFMLETKLAGNATAFAHHKKLHNNLNKGSCRMWPDYNSG